MASVERAVLLSLLRVLDAAVRFCRWQLRFYVDQSLPHWSRLAGFLCLTGMTETMLRRTFLRRQDDANHCNAKLMLRFLFEKSKNRLVFSVNVYCHYQNVIREEVMSPFIAHS